MKHYLAEIAVQHIHYIIGQFRCWKRMMRLTALHILVLWCVFAAAASEEKQENPIEVECNYPAVNCDTTEQFRRFEGTCNNLRNPHWGKENRIQKRVIPNAYDDGKGKPRATACGKPLPNPRLISNVVHKSGATTLEDDERSLLLMTFGQFLDHDLVLTADTLNPDDKEPDCCGKDKKHEACFTITIPRDDPKLRPYSCMNFVRSKARLDCGGVRQQINLATSWLDLSQSYGISNNTAMDANALRTFRRGTMKGVLQKLPQDETDSLCERSLPLNPPEYYCPKAGDPRVPVTPVLSAMHTIFHREHNRLAKGLAAVNPDWSDEQLFQTARKINIAQYQHIVYNEFLPTIIGKETLIEYNMDIKADGFKDTYNESVDGTIANSFAAGVFRFGHSLIMRYLGMMDYDFNDLKKPEVLENHFLEPKWYHTLNGKGLEYMLIWNAVQKCPKSDRILEDSVRNSLFQQNLDLAALNIQRGRDHGIPSYNAFREGCGLSTVTNFGTGKWGLVDHTQEAAVLLRTVYNGCIDAIDLFTGALSEIRLPGSLLGPTHQCWVARQFQRLRHGDRFFYERNDPVVGFKADQLNEIKKVKLSTLICLNSDAETIQQNIFYTQQSTKSGPMLECEDIVPIDLSKWTK